ncbi:alternative ribosome rescue aminoacyl-tRNA hydrolase ArfB [Crocinitomix algicola]|uniref:alternative ribosome rescue aminoacyl-tRNA hydrolase ArfB n=1 Tax=Crocinitomix algicola TaxID=1740263 RepID=UPI0008733D7B|nr:alternative ribosome rescue aminoacyl-tRNA hydrolase ArfB [Crocinitomix algicola]
MRKEVLLTELKYKTARSSGPGGQNVNKIESKVYLFFNVRNSLGLTENEKSRVEEKLKNLINLQGDLILNCDESRSQLKNKTIVQDRFLSIINEAIQVKKIRKPTKPSKGSIAKRKGSKQKNSVKKELRKKPSID